ncbi:hypothetical protein AB0C27_28385 [Nonomuraea sp. NPDC048882]|uniref:hypothetical protein n=1 Tax=unclassified Nonomuraea TaxID=2593643 RepID=UPI000AA899AB
MVTHAAHALSPTSRALTDDQITAIAASDVIGVSLEGVSPSPAGIVADVMTGIAHANWLRVLHATW